MSALEIVLGSTVYGLAGVVCARLTAGHLAWHFANHTSHYCFGCRENRPASRPDGEQWLGAWCLALAAAIVWPVIGLLICFPSERWSVGEERRQIQRRQAARIAELEKELGL